MQMMTSPQNLLNRSRKPCTTTYRRIRVMYLSVPASQTYQPHSDFAGFERSHRHQPDELKVFHRIDLLGEMHRRADGDAELARLFAGIELHKHGNFSRNLRCLRVDLFSESQAVDAVNHAHERQDR